MKLLFLDFDGVLNSEQSTLMHWRKGGKKGIFVTEEHMCPISCSNLQWLMDCCPDVNIVISSTWRVFNSLEELRKILLEHCGIAPERILGVTPNLVPSVERGIEVQAWLDRHTTVPEHSVLAPTFTVSDFMIVDDEGDMAHLTDTNFVKTDYKLGLTINDARVLIERFKGVNDWV